MRTGSCKYAVTCKFHHPQPAALGALVPMSPYGNNGAPSSPAPQPYPPGLPSWAMTRSPYLTPRLQGPSSFAPVILPSPQGIMSMPGWNTYPVSNDSIRRPPFTCFFSFVNVDVYSCGAVSMTIVSK